MSFMLSVIHADGKEFRFKPGSQMERDLIHAVAEKLKLQKIGFFRTKKRVLTAVTAALHDVLYEAKSEIIP